MALCNSCLKQFVENIHTYSDSTQLIEICTEGLTSEQVTQRVFTSIIEKLQVTKDCE